MTAIEVLVATVLASLMLASVMGVLGGLARQQKSIVNRSELKAWHTRMADQIEWDLQNSQEFVVSADGIRLIGFAGRSFSNSRPTNRPTAIEYYLLRSGTEQYFVRCEEHLDERTNQNWRVDVVGRGIVRMELGQAAISQATNGRPNFPSQPIVQRVPERIELRIFESASNEPTFTKSFVL
jgi:hypothetical protein